MINKQNPIITDNKISVLTQKIFDGYTLEFEDGNTLDIDDVNSQTMEDLNQYDNFSTLIQHFIDNEKLDVCKAEFDDVYRRAAKDLVSEYYSCCGADNKVIVRMGGYVERIL